eukprot:c9969_g1_i1.p1 GENE.c9969_g1_i1~~c9969_g1_i1.p1  ORF type:complete len:491 (-),score=128.23 c9969_g1_i1:1401-2873(-)
MAGKATATGEDKFSASLEPIRKQIKPVKYDGKKVKIEVKAIGTLFEDIKGPWEKREAAIKRLAGMAMARIVDEREFTEALKDISRQLGEQVIDLRSQIVRAMCAAIVMMAEELGEPFDGIFDQYLLPNLLKQLAVKALPIKEPAHLCILGVLELRPNLKVLKTLKMFSTDKEKIIRGRVAEYLEFVCANWTRDPAILQHEIADLLNILKPLLQDGSEIVREFSRKCIVDLSEPYPRAVVSTLLSLDPKVFRLIEPDLSENLQSLILESSRKPAPVSTGGGSGLAVPNRSNIRSSTGRIDAPVLKPRLSGGPARLNPAVVDPNGLRRTTEPPDAADYGTPVTRSTSTSAYLGTSMLAAAQQPNRLRATSDYLSASTLAGSLPVAAALGPAPKRTFSNASAGSPGRAPVKNVQSVAARMASMDDLDDLGTPRSAAQQAQYSPSTRATTNTYQPQTLQLQQQPMQQQMSAEKKNPSDMLRRLQKLREEVMNLT